MKAFSVAFLALLTVPILGAVGEESRSVLLMQQGITALKAADADRSKLIDAIGFLSKASDGFTEEGNERCATDANALLYWCRKKLTIDEIQTLQKAAPVAAGKAEAVVTVAVRPEDAKAWLERADEYATRVSDPLLKAVRYFEVADRFRNTPEGFKALDLSLKLMQQASGGQRVAAAPAPQGDGKPQEATLDRFAGKWIKVDTDTIFYFKEDGTISAPTAMIRGTWKVQGEDVTLYYGGSQLVLKIVNDDLLRGKWEFRRRRK